MQRGARKIVSEIKDSISLTQVSMSTQAFHERSSILIMNYSNASNWKKPLRTLALKFPRHLQQSQQATTLTPIPHFPSQGREGPSFQGPAISQPDPSTSLHPGFQRRTSSWWLHSLRDNYSRTKWANHLMWLKKWYINRMRRSKWTRRKINQSSQVATHLGEGGIKMDSPVAKFSSAKVNR